MIFVVNPSIRSTVQCNRCLRYGHTQKFCRSDPRCSHCGISKHTISECPTVHATDPSCFFCKLPHVATDRSCQEWSTQKDIKKIMATENISYKDALVFKKNKCYSSANTFSDVVKSQPPISEIPNPTPLSVKIASLVYMIIIIFSILGNKNTNLVPFLTKNIITLHLKSSPIPPTVTT